MKTITTGKPLESGKKILHLVSRGHRGKYCAGQWKDIQSFNALLDKLDCALIYQESEFEDPAALCRYCRESGATHIIIYYSFWPELLRKLRKSLPGVKIFVRTVNAEAFQHWQRAEIDFIPSRKNIRSIYGAIRLGWRDRLCRKYADGLLGISAWDNRHYWSRLPGSAGIYNVPYVCPWPSLRSHVAPGKWLERENSIVCLAGGRDPIGRSMLTGFGRLADHLSGSRSSPPWRFLLSPGLLDTDVRDSLRNVVHMDSLAEPWDLLCGVKCLAVLTELGFGAKTTVVDGLAAGCNVLVHPKIAARLAPNIREKCIVLDPENLPKPEELYAKINTPCGESVNQELEVTAFRELKKAFSCN